MSLPGETSRLCTCGHSRDRHDDDGSCTAVEDRRDLLDVFDDGKHHDIAYCACMRYRGHVGEAR